MNRRQRTCRHHYVYNTERTQKFCLLCKNPGPKVPRRKHERHDRRAGKSAE